MAEAQELEALRQLMNAGPPSQRVGPGHMRPGRRRLNELKSEEVCKLLQHLELGKYAESFQSLGMTGADLSSCSLEELEQAGVNFRPHRERLLRQVTDYRRQGVPMEALGLQLTRQPRSASDDECTFIFVLADKIRESVNDRKLPRLQELRRDRPEWLIPKTFTRQSACDGSLVREHLSVSHRWEADQDPDTTGAQLLALRDFLQANRQIKFVWIE